MTSLLRYLRTRPAIATLAVVALLGALIAIGVAVTAGKRREQHEAAELAALNALRQPERMGSVQIPPSPDAKTLELMQQYQLALRAAMGAGAPANYTASADVGTQAQTAPPPIVVKGESLARAFRSGQLPAPLPQPQGTPEQAAAELSKRVIADDEQSTAALLTALQMSGFSVRADNGSLAYESVKSGQGIVIDAWEVAGLAKLYGEDLQVRLTDLSRALRNMLAPLKNVPVDALLVDGIRTAAQGKRSSLRFWAEFIAELGRQSSAPYDLLAPHVDTAKVTLDAVQLSLILRRLAADVLVANGRRNRQAQWAPARQSDWSSPRAMPARYQLAGETGPDIRSAFWQADDRPRIVLVAEGGGSSAPCSMSELAAKFLDADAYANTNAFDRILEHLAEHGSEGAESFGNSTTAANILLAMIKLYVYYAALETDITMSGAPPLERTKSVHAPGERRTLTATVRENTGKWQTLNCTRIALNGANLDFSLPSDGPVAGVRTQWQLAAGGLSVHNNQITYAFVEFVSPDGTPLIQSAMVPISNPAAPTTDEEGHTHIDIEGVKQPEELRSPIAVMKQAEVRFSVAPKAVSFSQDAIDAVGVGASPLGPGTFVNGMVETALRSNLHLSKTLYIPVKDWRSCEGGWGGTASFRSTSETVQRNDGSDNTWVNTTNEVVDAALRLPADTDSGPSRNGALHGTYTGSYTLSGNMVNVYPPVRDFPGATITKVTTVTANGEGNADVAITPLAENQYQIQLGLNGDPLHGEFRTHTSCAGQCKGRKEPDENRPFLYPITGMSVVAKADPAHPEKLSGETTLKDTPAAGQSTDVRWDLTQCQGEQ